MKAFSQFSKIVEQESFWHKNIRQERIIAYLYKNDGKNVTRGEIAKNLNIATTTVYDDLIRLNLKGIVKKSRESNRTTRGRPKEFWHLTDEYKRYYELHKCGFVKNRYVENCWGCEWRKRNEKNST